MGLLDRIQSLGGGLAEVGMGRLEARLDEFISPGLEKAKTRAVVRRDESGLVGTRWTDHDEDPGELPPLYADQDPRSLFKDPYSLMNTLGFRDKPSPVSDGALKHMVRRAPPVGATINRRITQITSFGEAQHDRHGIGYSFIPRDRHRKMDRALEKRAARLEEFFSTTGWTRHPEERDDFTTFLHKFATDSWTIDRAGIEIVWAKSYSGKKQPAEFYAVDGSTLFRADQRKIAPDEDDTKAIRYVQVVDGIVANEYRQEDLAFCVRRPKTDLLSYGYGCPETEEAISTVVSMIWSLDYNKNAFSQGMLQKGLLNLKGKMSRQKFKAFRKRFYESLVGAHNAWRTPILNSEEGAEWIALHASNRDMEYVAYFDFLLKVWCAWLGMDPAEVYFQYGTGDQSRPMFEGANKARLIESKDTGLKPGLRWIAARLNTHLVRYLDPELKITFAGLNARTPEEEVELDTKRASSGVWKFNELRKERGLKPIPKEEGGELTGSEVQFQFLQMQNGNQQAQQQMQMQGGGGIQEGLAQMDSPDEGQGEQGPEDDEQGEPNEKQQMAPGETQKALVQSKLPVRPAKIRRPRRVLLEQVW